jgi:hypothetical protein
MPQSSLGLLRRRLAAASPHRLNNNDAVRRPAAPPNAAFHRNPHAERVQHLEHMPCPADWSTSDGSVGVDDNATDQIR